MLEIKREEQDFATIYQMYIDDMYNYGTSMGFSHDTCLDAIQDVFYTIYIKNNFSEITNIKFYLFRSLKNKLFDSYKAGLHIAMDVNINTVSVAVDETVADIIIEEEDRQVMINKVGKLLASLTERQREAIYLRYMQEFEYEKIGELMDMSPESVRKLVYRGISKLREHTNGSVVLLLTLYFMQGCSRYIN